jgi:hypothetical protein
MSFTESNTVEQTILDAVDSRSGLGPLVMRENPSIGGCGPTGGKIAH